MILHKYKIIFIHIPKNAGSSIERYFGVKPFKWSVPNYETLTGWCPKRRLHMQHATPKQLLETELIQQETWDRYIKFTIVRNSWDRSLSDYIWMMSDTGVSGSFKEYLNREGGFKRYLRNGYRSEYRGDHLTPQVEFTHINKKLVLDKIFKFEDLNADFSNLCKEIGVNDVVLPYDKKRAIARRHYSYYYNNDLKQLVSDIYHDDIKYFDFNFIDKKPTHEKFLFGLIRLHLLKFMSRR